MKENIKEVVKKEVYNTREAILKYFDILTLDYLLKSKNPYLLALMDFDCSDLEYCIGSLVRYAC